MISQINRGLQSYPINYSKDINKNYQRVQLTGNFNPSFQIFLYSLNEKGKPGFDVITPFETNNKENVLVNRGWIEKNLKNKVPLNLTSSSITGMLRTANRKNLFTPENDLQENIWFYLNLNDVEKFTGKKFSKYIVYLEDKNIDVPKPKKITIDIPNNHLKYAITWYAISISIIFYYLYFRQKK